MSRHRFYLAPAECRGATLVLTEGEARHARQVLRIEVGDLVTVLDGAGGEILAAVTAVGKGAVEMAVRERQVRAPMPYRLTLMQAITKGWSMEWIVEKATELGVSRLVPVVAARSVPRFGDKEDRARRVGKWQVQAVEALKQCGGAWLPEIAMPMGVEEVLAGGWSGGADTLGLVASFEPGARHPREWFAAWDAERRLRVQAAAIWVGPEGDFTAEELAALRDSGARPITLGPRVLRSETASLYCLSVLAYELQWLWGGMPAGAGDCEGEVTRQRGKDSS